MKRLDSSEPDEPPEPPQPRDRVALILALVTGLSVVGAIVSCIASIVIGK